MKIQTLNLNNLNFNIGKSSSGQVIIEAKLLEILNDSILIEMLNGDIEQVNLKDTNLPKDIDFEIGDTILLNITEEDKVVLDKAPNKLPSDKAKTIETKNQGLDNLLKGLNLKQDDRKLSLLDTLIKDKVPLQEKNLLESFKIMEKLDNLIAYNGETDKVLEIIKPNENMISSQVLKELMTNRDFIQSDLLEELIVEDGLKDLELKNLIVNDFNEAEEVKGIEVKASRLDMSFENKVIDEFLEKISILDEKDVLNLVSLMNKTKLKPTIKNIDMLVDLVENKDVFYEPIEKLFSKMKDNNVNNLTPKLVEEEKSISLKEFLVNDTLDKLLSKDSDKLDSIKNNIDIENKLNLLNQLGKEMYFLHIPIASLNREIEGTIDIIKKNRSGKDKDKPISIFINLSTNNLGNVKIGCLNYEDRIDLRLKINKEDIELFKDMKNILVDKVLAIGYILNKIDFTFDDYIDFNKDIVETNNELYFLDIKV